MSICRCYLFRLTRSLPLSDIWRSLACVACKQTSTQRLKAIQLLLRIIAAQKECLPRSKSTTSSDTTLHPLSLPPPLDPSPPPRPAIDLSLLRPLWNLYSKVTAKDDDSSSMQQPMVRALTELFLQAENLALVSDWDLVEREGGRDREESERERERERECEK